MIAVFAKDQDLISADLYASIVLAVLISTILPPFALRYTITKFNKIAERIVQQAEDLERNRATIDMSPEEQEANLRVSMLLYMNQLHIYSHSCFLFTNFHHIPRKISGRTKSSFFVFKSNVLQRGGSSPRLYQRSHHWSLR